MNVRELLLTLQELNCDVLNSEKEDLENLLFSKSKSRSALIKWISHLFCENPAHLNSKDELSMPAISDFWYSIGLLEKKQKVTFFCAKLSKEEQSSIWDKVFTMLQFYKRLKMNSALKQDEKKVQVLELEDAALETSGQEISTELNEVIDRSKPTGKKSIYDTLGEILKSVEKMEGVDLSHQKSFLPPDFYSNLEHFNHTFSQIDQYNKSVNKLSHISFNKDFSNYLRR